MKAVLTILSVFLGLTACEEPRFNAPQTLGGKEISAQVLSRGHRVYRRYCEGCHGEYGDGRGDSSWGQWPSPRDFRRARFKFAGIPERGLPDDAELARIIQNGLNGTAMRAWDLRGEELDAVIQYIKTFSFKGEGFRDPELKVVVPKIPEDPFAGADMGAVIERGKQAYHTRFFCTQCHAQYATGDEIKAWGQQPIRTQDVENPVPKPALAYNNVLVPPDFKRHLLRSVREDEQGKMRVDDLYRVIAWGLQGPMPAYNHLKQEDIWAVAHYVRSLAAESK